MSPKRASEFNIIDVLLGSIDGSMGFLRGGKIQTPLPSSFTQYRYLVATDAQGWVILCPCRWLWAHLRKQSPAQSWQKPSQQHRLPRKESRDRARWVLRQVKGCRVLARHWFFLFTLLLTLQFVMLPQAGSQLLASGYPPASFNPLSVWEYKCLLPLLAWVGGLEECISCTWLWPAYAWVPGWFSTFLL